MLPEIKLVISQNCKIIKAVTKPVDINNFVKTIENFQEVANATLTEMIDDLGGSGKHIRVYLFFNVSGCLFEIHSN